MKSVRFLQTLNFVLIFFAICCFSTNSYSGILDGIKKSIEDTTGNSKEAVKEVKESQIKKTSFKANTRIEPIDDGGIRAYGLSWNSTIDQTKQYCEGKNFKIGSRSPKRSFRFVQILYEDVTGHKLVIDGFIWISGKAKEKGDFIKRCYYGFSKAKNEMVACLIDTKSRTRDIESLEKYGKPRRIRRGSVKGNIYPHKADVAVASMSHVGPTAVVYICISRLKKLSAVEIEKERKAEAKRLEKKNKRNQDF
jgi:hypothetical protein